jgi:hypothetical protein
VRSRKIRSDSKLKLLSEETQARIADYARAHSIKAVVEWLKAAGVQTSTRAVSEFLAWHRRRQRPWQLSGRMDRFRRRLFKQLGQ